MNRFLALALVLTIAPLPAPAQTSRRSVVSDAGELAALVKSRRFSEAWERAGEFRAMLASTRAPAELVTRVDRLIAAAGLEVVGPAAGFRGTIAIRDGGVVEVTYDMSAAGWQRDFELGNPLSKAKPTEAKDARVAGTTALSHVAIWMEPLTLEVTGRALMPNDFGPVLIDCDGSDGRRLLTGIHNSTYLEDRNGAERSATRGHLLVLAGRDVLSRPRMRAAEVLGRSAMPLIAAGNTVRCSLSVRGRLAEFITRTGLTAVGGMSSELAPEQALRRIRAGVFVRDSAFDLSRFVIRGRLDPVWVREESIRIRAALETVTD